MAHSTSPSVQVFTLIDALLISVLVLVFLAALLFSIFMVRPFVKASFTESRRVAELLSQLPSDMDAEEMVVASYEAVLNHHINQSEPRY